MDVFQVARWLEMLSGLPANLPELEARDAGKDAADDLVTARARAVHLDRVRVQLANRVFGKHGTAIPNNVLCSVVLALDGSVVLGVVGGASEVHSEGSKQTTALQQALRVLSEKITIEDLTAAELLTLGRLCSVELFDAFVAQAASNVEKMQVLTSGISFRRRRRRFHTCRCEWNWVERIHFRDGCDGFDVPQNNRYCSLPRWLV